MSKGGKGGGAGKTGGRGNYYWDAKTKIKNKQKECPNLSKCIYKKAIYMIKGTL